MWIDIFATFPMCFELIAAHLVSNRARLGLLITPHLLLSLFEKWALSQNGYFIKLFQNWSLKLEVFNFLFIFFLLPFQGQLWKFMLLCQQLLGFVPIFNLRFDFFFRKIEINLKMHSFHKLPLHNFFFVFEIDAILFFNFLVGELPINGLWSDVTIKFSTVWNI